MRYDGHNYTVFDFGLPVNAIGSPVMHSKVTGRWFIRMGFAGFNGTANNGRGYATQRAALAAIRRYQETSPTESD